MAGNPNYDALLTTTVKKYRRKLEDNVFSARPLVNWMKRKDHIRMEDGGTHIVEPLMYAQNSTAKSYSGYDALDITPQDGLTAAEFDWKQFAASISISGIEEAKNNGEAAIIKLLTAKMTQTEETIAEVLDEMLFGDGTTVGRNWPGLGVMVGDHLSSITTVGGINCATAGNEFWRSVVVNAAADADAERNTGEWTNVFNTASRGNDHPDFLMTTQALFEHYEATLLPGVRYTDETSANQGFLNLLFKNVPVFFDVYCPSGVTYLLNSKYLHLVGHSSTWFRNTGFKEAPDRDAKWAQILLYGSMTISNRARQGKVYGQTVV